MCAAKSLVRISFVTIFLCVLYAPLALAQTAPAKQFRVILTYPPGGASDIMGRIIAQKLGEIWGQTVLVENRSGANGSIGIDYRLLDTSEPLESALMSYLATRARTR